MALLPVHVSAGKANTHQHAALEMFEKFLFHKRICEHGVLGTSVYETNLSMHELINAHQQQMVSSGTFKVSV